MNTSHLKTFVSISSTLLAAGLLHAQPSVPARSPVTRGLPRLADTAKAGAAAPIGITKYEVDALAPGSAGVVKSRKAGLDVLTLGAGTEWSRPLRGSGREPQFVSFLFCASESTIVEMGGARLGVTLSPADGSLQLMFDEQTGGGMQWRSLGLHATLTKYAGETLVSLPLLTVHLDPVAGVWSLYVGMRLVANHLPLIAGANVQQKFTLKAGSGGAWLSQLIMADENPLCEDANANGIDDGFEKQFRGSVLAANATLMERKFLAQQWQASQRTTSPAPLFIRRPIPDSIPAQRGPGR